MSSFANRQATCGRGVRRWGLIWTHLHSFGRPFVQSEINCIGRWAFSVVKSLLFLDLALWCVGELL